METALQNAVSRSKNLCSMLDHIMQEVIYRPRSYSEEYEE